MNPARSSISRKGQWFIVAAVIASSVFLGISVIFKSFAATDASQSAVGGEEFYFWSAQKALRDVLANAPAGCANMAEALAEYNATASRQMAELGYFLFLNVTLNMAGDCASREAGIGILLASDRAVFYNNLTPADVVPQIA